MQKYHAKFEPSLYTSSWAFNKHHLWNKRASKWNRLTSKSDNYVEWIDSRMWKEYLLGPGLETPDKLIGRKSVFLSSWRGQKNNAERSLHKPVCLIYLHAKNIDSPACRHCREVRSHNRQNTVCLRFTSKQQIIANQQAEYLQMHLKWSWLNRGNSYRDHHKHDILCN